MANEVETVKSSLLDTNFGSGGVATAGITADPTYRCGMAIDAEGNIVVAGTAGYPDPSDSSTTYDEFAIVRFASGGWLDSSFGNNGVVLDASGPGNYNYATAVAIQSDGGVVVAGRSTGYGLDLVRYLPDGTEDPNFQNLERQRPHCRRGQQRGYPAQQHDPRRRVVWLRWQVRRRAVQRRWHFEHYFQ